MVKTNSDSISYHVRILFPLRSSFITFPSRVRTRRLCDLVLHTRKSYQWRQSRVGVTTHTQYLESLSSHNKMSTLSFEIQNTNILQLQMNVFSRIRKFSVYFQELQLKICTPFTKCDVKYFTLYYTVQLVYQQTLFSV